MKERRFTHVTGFGCNSRYVSVYDDGRVTITSQEGEETQLKSWKPEEVFRIVGNGFWKEVPVEVPTEFKYVKIRVANAAQSEAAQKLLAEMGYQWWGEKLGTVINTHKYFLYGDTNGEICHGSTEEYFKECEAVELKLVETVSYKFEELPRKTIQIDGRTYFEDEVLKRVSDLAEVV